MNKIVKHGIKITLVGLVVGACVSATVNEPSACADKSTSWSMPTLPSVPTQYQNTSTCSQYSAPIPSASTHVSFDFSSAVSKVGNVADNLTVNINQLLINSPDLPLNWVDGVNVYVDSVGDAGATPQLLATYTMPEGGVGSDGLDVHVVMPADQILQTLKDGPVDLTITLMGGMASACNIETLLNDNSTLNGSVHMCVDVSGDFSKNL